ncbi:SLAM family member 8-like [Acanthopagrus latus]|uniref:SLAM family member 8-like n=1 Tax=Acanthopagrus latus TaxID=8177 RepID=UPI00187CB42C|nr:SLAM family member 8-like [Acanthopagrus latus]
MVGGRLRCLGCVLTCTSVLLFGVFLQDVEASSCPRVIHKKVGDTVELPSCLPTDRATDRVTMAIWKYGAKKLTDKNKIFHENQFKGRLELNHQNFSLTVKQLTLQDSGNFSFLSDVNDKQRETVIISLQVHEPITKQPTLTYNSTWHPSNDSCTVFLECSAPSDSNVDYKWTVSNQTRSGSRLQYILSVEDGDTDFTCTIYNLVTEMSMSQTLTCSNVTQDLLNFGTILILGVVGGGCLIMIIIVTVLCVCYCKQRQSGSDANDLTVYADISEVAINDETIQKPCSVYETIDNRGNSHPVTPGPQTVYDKIQLSRVRNASVSPYQEIS